MSVCVTGVYHRPLVSCTSGELIYSQLVSLPGWPSSVNPFYPVAANPVPMSITVFIPAAQGFYC